MSGSEALLLRHSPCRTSGLLGTQFENHCCGAKDRSLGQPEVDTSVSILVLPLLGCVSFPSFLTSLDLSFLVCGLVILVVPVVRIKYPCSSVSIQPSAWWVVRSHGIECQ